MESRDGSNSNPSVSIYRGTNSAHANAIFLNSSIRRLVSEDCGPGLDAKTYGLVNNPKLDVGRARKNRLLVIARRGSGIDYTEKNISPSRFQTIRDIRHSHRDTICRKSTMKLPDLEDRYSHLTSSNGARGAGDLRSGGSCTPYESKPDRWFIMRSS